MTRRGGFLATVRAAWRWRQAGRRAFTYPYMPVLERIAHALEAQVPQLDTSPSAWAPFPVQLPKTEPWIDATTWLDTNRNCSPRCPCQVDLGGDDD